MATRLELKKLCRLNKFARRPSRLPIGQHIARVGQAVISRNDFNIERGYERSQYEQIYGSDVFTTSQGQQLLQSIETQIALRLTDDLIKMKEVELSGYRVKNSITENVLDDYVKQKQITLDQLKGELQSLEYPFEHFKQKFAQRVRLQNYLEEKVLAESLDPDDRQQRYGNWLANARSLAKVVYYDKDLEQRVKTGGSGSCGSGGCSVTR